MAISPKLKNYLEQEKVGFEVLPHPLVYTASETAGTQHIPGKQMVKVVIVKSGETFLMCLLTAVQFVDFDKVGACTGLPELQLAKEQEIVKIFPDYPLGAEPPFGHLYGLKVIMDRQVETNHDITFNAGTHTDIIKMKLKDFLVLEKPTIGDIGVHI